MEIVSLSTLSLNGIGKQNPAIVASELVTSLSIDNTIKLFGCVENPC